MDEDVTAQAGSQRGSRGVALALGMILALAAALRLRGLGWGLPALYDQDEPIFVLTALKLLRESTLNPGWFGHPGTTTIYALALIYAAVAGIGILTGRFADAAGFARAIYADPGVVILPGRCFAVACGLLTILLAFVLARRLFGTRAGLVAALLLAVDPVHVRYSQIIRTDMHETVFLLLCVLASVNVARFGRWRDYLWAGAWLGLAIATKWPAALAIVAIAGAASFRMYRVPQERSTQLRRLVAVGPITLATLVAASPFVVLDHATVLANLSGEARDHHPGATGQGFGPNLWWYVSGPLVHAVGVAGALLAPLGLVAAARRSPAFGITALPYVLVSLAAISVQALVWERWIVPLLPFVTVALAVLLDGAVRWAEKRFGAGRGHLTAAAAATVLTVPVLVAGQAAARERAHDTRAAASAWLRARAMPGSTVIVEQLAFDLLSTGWRFLYPVGDAGCVDVAANLRARIPYSTIARWRGGRPVIDVGTIAPARFSTCRADWAILVDYDRYLAEHRTYDAELRVYRALIARGRIAATFRPVPGQVGGPVVRVVRLDARSAGWVPLR